MATEIVYVSDGQLTNPIQHENKGSLIAHVVNNYGKWGGGVSGLISEAWRKPKDDYEKAGYNDYIMGTNIITQVQGGNHQIAVASMVAQRGLKTYFVNREFPIPPIKYDSLILCLKRLIPEMIENDFSFHCMKLGTYFAKANWEIVRAILEEFVCSENIPVYVYDDQRISQFLSLKNRGSRKNDSEEEE